MRQAYVVGGGLAGLSAAVALAEAGRAVTVYESAATAGGRCRSYFDRELGCRVDNGNHLLLSGNVAAFAYLDRIGARHTMAGPGASVFPFVDLADGRRWTVRPNPGRVPWWILNRARRVPDTRFAEYLSLLALRRAPPDATVEAVLHGGTLYRRLLAPLAVAALNTAPERGLARLLAAVVDETLMRGGAACIPCFPAQGMSETFVDPAIAWLAAHGSTVACNRRVTGLSCEAGLVTALQMPDGAIAVAEDAAVVVAVPPWSAGELLPDLAAPDDFEAIVNVHFRADLPADNPAAPAGFIGVVGGTAEWVFVKPGHVSVTISAASRIVDTPADAIAALVWPEVRAALALAGEMPAWRVVKEKRATFAATAEQERRRPATRTAFANLALAGDWISTGLPATIEGAIRSGRRAAESLTRA
jgi:squalene-associated FAD-dependent desaturase